MTELLLIDLVKRHEAIYKRDCPEYRDRATRQAAWASIAELCGSTDDYLIFQLKNVKSPGPNFATVIQTPKSGVYEKSDHKFDPWRYEGEMSFLDPYLKENPSLEYDDVEFVEDIWGRNSGLKAAGINRITTTLEREHLLIDLIRRYEVIYNTKCREYHDAKERHAAWVEIADLHGSSVTQCKEAWMKLRNCYTNAIKRQMVKTSKNLPTRPWRFEKEMSFLRPFLNLRYNCVDSEVIYDAEDSWDECLSPNSKESDVTTRTAYKRKSTSNFEIDADDSTPELIYNNQEFDDVDHFFLSMSRMTKKLPKIDQLRIKLDLHKAINEAELKQLEVGRKKDVDLKKTGVKLEVLSVDQDATESQMEEVEYLSYD